MKQLIHNYLSEYFYISKERFPCIKPYGTEMYLFNVYTLSRMLVKIFDLTHKQIKWYVKSWCKKQDRGFNFRRYWLRSHAPLAPGIMYAPYITVVGYPILNFTPSTRNVDPIYYSERTINPDNYGTVVITGSTRK